MVTTDKIPEALFASLDRRGVDRARILLVGRSDKDADGVFCDNYLAVTDSELIITGGSSTLCRRENSKPTDAVRLERSFSEISYSCYMLDELTGFKIEELISGARMVAKRKSDGAFVLITFMTNTQKNSMFDFVKYINEYIEKKTITVSDDEKESAICPKCGYRYADPVRKICPHCMDKVRIAKRMWQFCSRYKVSIVIMIAILVVTGVFGIIAPYASNGFFIDQVLSEEGSFYGQILLVLAIMAGVQVVNMLAGIMTGIVSSRISAKMVYDLKKVIFSAIERLSISFFTGRQTGGLMAQVNNDANTIYWFFTDGLPYYLVNIVLTLAVFIIMLIMNPLLALLAVSVVPVLVVLIKFIFSKMEKLHGRRFGKSRALNGILNDVLSGARIVKAFSRERDEIDRFNGASKRLADADRTLGVFGNTSFPFVSLIMVFSSLIIWAAGGAMVMRGDLSYGMLMTFIAYLNMLLSPMFRFVDMVTAAADCMNAMNRLMEIMDAQPEVKEKENPVRLPSPEGRITFKDVEFSYVKNRKVIDGISFDIEPGRVIGIVGHTGAGKSTIANLLIRLYDPSSGEILIDGINIRDIAFEDIRRNIAIVSQETYLFVGTIMENIKYARPEASDEEVIEAAKIAGAHDFIVTLPDAYSTRIGFGYKDLSGGERQRVSIARAILRNPKILILDEATAAMDTATERKIQLALEQLVKGRTTIMIAHRLSTLRDADYLIVIENGKMPEHGTHRELIEKKGIYYNLYKLQLEALRNIGIEADA